MSNMEDERIAVPSQTPDYTESIPASAVDKYKTIGIALVVGLVALIGGYFYYDYYSKEREKEAQEQAFYAAKYYMKDSLDKAINGTAAFPGLKKFVDEYGGTKAGNTAKYMLGTAYLSKGKIDDGLSQLESFDKGDNLVSAQAYAAIGFAYEEKGNFGKAADMYIKASKALPNAVTSPEYMLSAARCYEEAKDNDKALSIYKELKQKYPLSDPGRQAEKYIAKLEK
jgi:TolA-binding protein